METERRFKPGDKVRVIDELLFKCHPKGSIRTVSHYVGEFVYLVEGAEEVKGGWREHHFELVEGEDAPLKFKNAVEESIWVSFICSLLQTENPIIYADRISEAADELLKEYRARLVDGKPNAK